MPLTVQEQAAPSTPATGYVTVYAKTDGLLYGKDDAGTETQLSNSSSSITLGTLTATTSGTSVDFNITSTAKKITVSFAGVSVNGSTSVILQIGDSGGIENTGYGGSGSVIADASGTTDLFTTGFAVANLVASGTVFHGQITLSLMDESTNLWSAMAVCGGSDSGITFWGGGSKALSATLDRVRITTTGGTATFDAGSANVLWQG